jgi:hypothetical protein
MKRVFVFIAVLVFCFLSCDTGVNKPSDPIEEVQGGQVETPAEVEDAPVVETPIVEQPVIEGPVVETPITQVDPAHPVKPTAEEMTSDIRLSSFEASGVWWLRKPYKTSASIRGSVYYNIALDDPIAQYCTEPGWSYMFYDDGAVIGIEPFPENVSITQQAVWLTVTAHNQEYPNEPWGYINVPPVGPPPPITSNDPILGKWQFAICLDDGSIVDGPYTAEFDFNWAFFKESTARAQLEAYNRDHDPDAHIVWGTEE